MNTQRAFTFVELIVLILILGILAATALPRFMDSSQDIHQSAVNGVAAAFAAIIELRHTQWQAQGGTPGINTISLKDGTRVIINNNGWPDSDDAPNNVMSDNACLSLWQQTINSHLASAIKTGDTIIHKGYVADGKTASCTYTYYHNDSANNTRKIVYNTDTGEVVITNSL